MQVVSAQMWLGTGDGQDHGYGKVQLPNGNDQPIIFEGVWPFLVFTDANGNFQGAEALLTQQQYQDFNPIPGVIDYVQVDFDVANGVPLSVVQFASGGAAYIEYPSLSNSAPGAAGMRAFVDPGSAVFNTNTGA